MPTLLTTIQTHLQLQNNPEYKIGSETSPDFFLNFYKNLLTKGKVCGNMSFEQGRRTAVLAMFSPGAYGARYDIISQISYFCDIWFIPIVFMHSKSVHYFFALFNEFLEVFHIATNTKELSINEQIRAKEARVIDDDGSQLGIITTKQALDIAYDKGLDLVEISPNSDPPVCRIMDYGKYRFDREKKEKEAKKKQKIVEIKEVQLSCQIDTHDFETKLNHARKFLSQGNKVKVSVKFKGRQMAHTEIGLEVIRKFGEACCDIGVIEKQPLLDGRHMLMFLAPKSASAKAKEQKSSEQQ